MAIELDEELLCQQIRRERDAFTEGAKIFRQQATLSTFQQRFLQDYLSPLTDAIKEHQDLIGKQRGKVQVADYPIAAMDAGDLALVTLMSVLYTLSTSHKNFELKNKEAEATFRRTAMKLGEKVRDEYFNEVDRETSNGDLELTVDLRLRSILMARQSNKWNAARRAQEIIDAIKDPDWWDLQHLIALGGTLIDMAKKTTGLFEKVYRAVGVDFEKKSAIVVLTPQGLDWLATKRTKRKEQIMRSGGLGIPINLPTIVEPKPWTELRGGGYYKMPAVLVKKNGENYIADTEYDAEQMPEVLSAVNTLQNTAWRINTPVFRHYMDAWTGATVKKLLTMQRLFLRKGKEDELDRLSSDRIVMIENIIDAAENLLAGRFYFPYQLDFRGRIYAIPQTINHQADDFARALIEFDEASAVNDESEYWTAIHLANVFGLNKRTLDKRYAWCNENRKQLEMFVRQPLKELDFWMQADERWGFLAAANAWIDIKNGASESHLPVFIDGRCNGLQHLSAMSRDSRAARAVNVICDGPPEDIYTEVAEKLEQLVKEDNGKWSKFWEGKIDRGLVKKPVMSTPYGVTPEGIKRQMRAASIQHKPETQALVYLRDKVIGAIEESMKGPTDVKDWLQKVARKLAKAGKPIIWTTPTGFRVVQDYRKPEFKRLTTKSFSVRYYLPVNGTRPVNAPRQELGIIANFVHSMDAAHLIKVVNALEAKGISQIAVVHDSYGVHADKVSTMNKIIREEFLKIYREPVLDRFIDEQIDRTGIKLPRFKEYGDLEIERVLESDYFFS